MCCTPSLRVARRGINSVTLPHLTRLEVFDSLEESGGIGRRDELGALARVHGISFSDEVRGANLASRSAAGASS